MYLVTASEMQRMDRETIDSYGIPGRVLMESAGRGAADVLADVFGRLDSKKVGVAAGRGNNGGDGFVVARCLAARRIAVTVFLLGKRENVRGEARVNLELLDPLAVEVIEVPDQAAFEARRRDFGACDIWVDAMLGTGLSSEVRGVFRDAIDLINDSGKPVLAVDIASGLDADSGQALGTCIRAHVTVTFGHAKLGHFCHPGRDFSGRLEIIDIGIPRHISDRIQPRQHLIRPRELRERLWPRGAEAHKGTTGHLVVVAASAGKTGAAVMTASAAMRAGAGLVTLAVAQSLQAEVSSRLVEAMTLGLPETRANVLGAGALKPILETVEGKSCLAVGPGIGTAPSTRNLVRQLIARCPVPLVIDADGLNCLASDPSVLNKACAPIVLTPHPGEMARLAGISSSEVQRNRLAVARRFAETHGVVVVLKGAGTLVAQPDGNVYVNPTGNPGMASGGMGDILTGIIAGYVTQGYAPEFAARLGVYLHGETADHLAHTRASVGYLASDIAAALPGRYETLIRG